MHRVEYWDDEKIRKYAEVHNLLRFNFWRRTHYVVIDDELAFVEFFESEEKAKEYINFIDLSVKILLSFYKWVEEMKENTGLSGEEILGFIKDEGWTSSVSR